MSDSVPAGYAKAAQLLEDLVDFVCEKLQPLTRDQADRFLELDQQLFVALHAIDLRDALPSIEKLRAELDGPDETRSWPRVQFLGQSRLPGDWEDGLFIFGVNEWLEELSGLREILKSLSPKADSARPIERTKQTKGETPEQSGKKRPNRQRTQLGHRDPPTFVLLIAALTTYHEYENGRCDQEKRPIGVRELATAAGVSPSRATDFFNAKFNDGKRGGHSIYSRHCAQTDRLTQVLRLLNNEVTPAILNRPLKRETEACNDDDGE